MPRRVGLPGASELFRPTSEPAKQTPAVPAATASPAGATAPAEASDTPVASGRVKHDEKITVYVSTEELLALERLRLDLRATHGLAVDRGRIVRAAIAASLADVADRGADAALFDRLVEP